MKPNFRWPHEFSSVFFQNTVKTKNTKHGVAHAQTQLSDIFTLNTFCSVVMWRSVARVSLSLTKLHSTKTYGGVDTEFHAFLTSALDGDDWSASRPGNEPSHFTEGGLDDRDSRVRFPAGTGNFSLHHRVQNGSGAHPASYPMNTGGSFPGGKAAGTWSWPFTSIKCRGQRGSGATPPLPKYAYMAWCLVKAQRLYLYHCVHTGSGTHPVSYPMGSRGPFPGGKVAGEWVNWPHTSV
jgi:hypothetical protein